MVIHLTISQGFKGLEMGEHYKKIDLAEVERLAASGLTQHQIGAALGISRRTIARRLTEDEEFADAYEKGRAGLCEEVANLLLDNARNGSVDACKFILDRRCDWQKNTKQELTVTPGPSIQINMPEGMVFPATA